jgi:uncharacterized protein
MASSVIKRTAGLLPTAIVWRRIDHPGHEWCRITRHEKGATIQGVVVLQWGRLPCSLEYVIRCNTSWHTREVLITGNLNTRRIAVHIRADTKRNWYYDGELTDSVRGCLDIDLGFSPSTNLLPIRRLGLVPGKPQEVTAAWVAFPSMKLQPLRQTYTRIDKERVRYESAGGRFTRDLRINRSGLVLDYPGLWQMEPAS